MSPFVFVASVQEARYDVLAQGKKVGVATYAILPRKGGGRVTRLRMAVGGQSIESVSDSDAKGVATRSVTSVRRGKRLSTETTVYSVRGDATVTLTGAKPFTVPGPKGSRKDPSELWFRGVVPTPGTWATFQALDVKTRAWQEVRVTYVGKRGAGYLVRQARPGQATEYVLDARGLPMSIERPGFRMVRR